MPGSKLLGRQALIRTGDRVSEWRFLVDENIDPDVVDEVRRHGVDAEWVPDVLSYGADDFDDIPCREGTRHEQR